MQSSKVVFPAPDAPNKMVIPAGTSNAASSSKFPPLPANCLRIWTLRMSPTNEVFHPELLFYFHGHTAHTFRFKAYTIESTANDIANSTNAVLFAAPYSSACTWS